MKTKQEELDAALKEYDRTVAPAQEAYHKAMAPIFRKYIVATNRALAAYKKRTARIEEKYAKVGRQ